MAALLSEIKHAAICYKNMLCKAKQNSFLPGPVSPPSRDVYALVLLLMALIVMPCQLVLNRKLLKNNTGSYFDNSLKTFQVKWVGRRQ